MMSCEFVQRVEHAFLEEIVRLVGGRETEKWDEETRNYEKSVCLHVITSIYVFG